MTSNDAGSNDISPLVSTAWLAERLDDPGIAVLDASYFVPGGVERARAQYLESHLPGAVFFDINDVADPAGPKEHAFPTADIFARKAGALGIGGARHVVAYDHLGGTCAAARVWFMFRAFGHERVSVLDGGRTKWIAEGRPMTAAILAVSPASFTSAGAPRLKSKADIRANIGTDAFQLLDARAQGRFEGTAPEPRAGLRAGHVPGSLNLPFLDMIEPDTHIWRTPDALRAAFTAAGVDLARPLATTCGSGVSACALALGAHLAGTPGVALYDGSWLDWGGDPATPVETGPARRPA